MSMIQTIVTSLFHGHSVKTDPMPDFNLERYLGEWHEIARLENWFERGLSSGQCAVPETLMREGFTFQYPDIRTFFNKAFSVKS